MDQKRRRLRARVEGRVNLKEASVNVSKTMNQNTRKKREERSEQMERGWEETQSQCHLGC